VRTTRGRIWKDRGGKRQPQGRTTRLGRPRNPEIRSNGLRVGEWREGRARCLTPKGRGQRAEGRGERGEGRGERAGVLSAISKTCPLPKSPVRTAGVGGALWTPLWPRGGSSGDRGGASGAGQAQPPHAHARPRSVSQAPPEPEGRAEPTVHVSGLHSVPTGGGRGRACRVCAGRTETCSPPTPPSESASWAGGNRCVDAAEACTEDARCQQLRAEYVAQCLSRAARGGCPRTRCRRALRRFFARGPPALTLALLFCPCAGPSCAERRRQTFVPTCAFSGPGAEPPSCLVPLDTCEQSRVCRCGREVVQGRGAGRGGRGRLPLTPSLVSHRPRLLAFQASCAPVPRALDGCPRDQGVRCLRAYAGLVGTQGGLGRGGALPGMPRPAKALDPGIGVPTGTAVTPNYVDNASARVAPWCDCGASGNRREECEAFRGLFTRNRCLGEGPWSRRRGPRRPMVPSRTLTACGLQSCRDSWTPTGTPSPASCRCPPQRGCWRGASCLSYFLSWLFKTCSD
uniref:GDNF/GAS1 domain-containing protein n=1 Tax=Oryctolagus cuniculus TaxID=9986 RepID=A0A5F9DMU3_RABIT